MKEKKKVLIVGGGTAGVPIANYLQNYFDVTIIEKSQYNRYSLIYKIPLMIGIIFRSETMNHVTKREFKLKDGRKIPFYESNLFGGASIMNGAVHVFGFESVWKKVLRRFNLSYADLLKSSDELYSYDLKDKHKISLMFAHQNVIDNAFIKTLNLKNISNGDMGYAEAQVCGPIQNTVRTFFRTSVLSLIKKQKFKLKMNEKVESILFDNKNKVIGLKTDKSTFEADYVILSAGVIGSCDLMLREQLKKEIFQNLPIGNRIQDHTNIRVNVFATQKLGSLNEVYDSLIKKILLGFKHITGKPTVMRGTGATSAAYLDLDNDGQIDTRIQILQFAEKGRHSSSGKMFGTNEPSFSISINAIHPESKGTIFLNGNSNIVEPNFLSDNKDIEILKLSLIYCIKLLKSEPISEYVREIQDEELMVNDPEKYIRDTMYSGHHLIGGLHEVVDENFQVIGTDGLYVCDASVFDRFVASNIHSSVALLADLFAKKFINLYKEEKD